MTKEQELILSQIKNFKPVMVEINTSEENYDLTRKMIYQWMLGGFEVEEIRKCIVPVKFTKSGETFNMEIRHLYTHMCMWVPHMREKYFDKMDESFIMDFTKIKFTPPVRSKFINDKVIKVFMGVTPIPQLNKNIHDSLTGLCQITSDFALLLGGTLNVEGYIDLYNRNDQYKNILHTKLDETKQPSEIEAEVDKILDELLELLGEEENPLKEVITTGGQIKNKQLAECMISLAYRPDESGRTIPILVNTNLFMNGLNSPSNYYLEAQASRKSSLANAFEMGKSGYFAKMLVEAAAGHMLAKDENGELIQECGTVKLVETEIKSKGHLDRLDGRYASYNENDKTVDKMFIIDKHNPELIGKKVFLRSPLTCGCKAIDGSSKHICATCYGELSKINADVSIGSLAAAKTSEPVSQDVLSTKHMVKTNSVEIDFGKTDFNKYCSIKSNEIIFNDDIQENVNKINIYIDKADTVILSDDEVDFNMAVKKFYIEKADGDKLEIKEKNDKLLYISPELQSVISNKRKGGKKSKLRVENTDGYIRIPVALLESIHYDGEEGEEGDLRIFIMSVDNNQSTAPYYEIMGLLNFKKKREEAGITTIEQLHQRLFDLICIAGVGVPSVFMELCWVDLIRDGDIQINYPTWTSKLGAANYNILSLASSLQDNPSIVTSIGFNRLKEQFHSALTYMKSAPSIYDGLFMTTLTAPEDFNEDL